MAKLKEEHCLSDLILLSVPSTASHPHQEEGTQTAERLGFHPALTLCKISIRPEPSWNVNYPRKHRVWLTDMTIGGSSWPGGMRDGKHKWPNMQAPCHLS